MEELRDKLVRMLEASNNKITDDIVNVSQELDKFIVIEQKKKVGAI